MQLVDVVGIAILVVELIFFDRKRSDRARDRIHDGRSLRTLWLSILAGVIVARALSWARFGPEFTLGELGRVVAVAILAAGFALRICAVVALGRFFTVDVAIREGHELVQTGLYRVVRHPAYTGLFAMFVGWSLTFENYTAIVALLTPLALALVHRVRIEETALVSAFGAAYETYRSRTKRFVPFVY
ncbi:MAG: isoprenylcysteine carboxylmethyltransferase family protein [Planctomycetota bacterium]|nr:isoprenylcysteine carboxylmethyltransferase family protein [Planctomycetota bacterium]